jgi:2-dehydro-3-deoxyphosphogluconate aldolase/(4S)-4-hydroxy-2-oxoglutarate aldolase
MNQVDSLGELGISPVVKIEDNRQAVDLTEVLLAGGHPCAGIILPTQAAAAPIRSSFVSQPVMLMGAGTVITLAQIRQLGARA